MKKKDPIIFITYSFVLIKRPDVNAFELQKSNEQWRFMRLRCISNFNGMDF